VAGGGGQVIYWRERVDGADLGPGSYWREWYCPVPPPHRPWRVLPGCEEWDPPGEDGLPVRRIYAIELAELP
jgi:hypothetical protein